MTENWAQLYSWSLIQEDTVGRIRYLWRRQIQSKKKATKIDIYGIYCKEWTKMHLSKTTWQRLHYWLEGLHGSQWYWGVWISKGHRNWVMEGKYGFSDHNDYIRFKNHHIDMVAWLYWTWSSLRTCYINLCCISWDSSLSSDLYKWSTIYWNIRVYILPDLFVEVLPQNVQLAAGNSSLSTRPNNKFIISSQHNVIKVFKILHHNLVKVPYL